MEAANPQRAALRLAAAAGGVMLTVCLAAATLVLLVLRPVAPQPIAHVTPVETAPGPEAFSEDSYRLPPDSFTPVSAGPMLALQPAVAPPAYVEPEEVEEEEPEETLELPHAEDDEPPAPETVSGPITIHNPAAFGPPEDDELPPIPTEIDPSTTAASPPKEPAFAPPAGKPPVGWEPKTTPITPAGESLADLATEGAAEEIAPPVIPAQPVVDREALLNYTTSTEDLSRRLAGEVRSGFQLGKSGAVFAARSRFVAVLRRIALAKDAEEGSDRHATALAEGLRTLDDADDFVPRGDALEAELDVAAIAASHGLDLLTNVASVAPHEAIARYSQHAAERLAEAAAGEPSGSMALYGLGKTYARLESQGDHPSAGRKSLVMFRAAVDTHPENYLAANELGVRLARVGRYEQACAVLRRAAAQPTAIATVHANLAAIEARLGHAGAAVIAQQQSDQLAQQERAAGEVSRRHGVQWVSPDAFRRADPRVASYAAPAPATAAPVTYEQPAPAPASPGGWSGFWQNTKQKLGWSAPAETPAPAAYAPVPPVAAHPQRVMR